MKDLGVIVDSRLRWGLHIASATQKGEDVLNALSRITSSLWEPSIRNQRLIYSAVVRSKMLYGSQVWAIRCDIRPLAKSLMSKLDKKQEKCLREITGGYKHAPKIILEGKAILLPLELHIQVSSLSYGLITEQNTVIVKTKQYVDSIWNHISYSSTRHTYSARNQLAIDFNQCKTRAIIEEANNAKRHREVPGQQKKTYSSWKLKQLAHKGNHSSITWKTP